MNLRLEAALRKLEENNLDGLIVSSSANITYLTKYQSRDSYFIISAKGCMYITDSRYTEEAKARLDKKIIVHKSNGSVFKTIARISLELGLKRIGFEARYLPFAEHKRIEEYLDKQARLIHTHSIIEKLREVKDEDEIKKIKMAVQITAKALKFIGEFIAPGQKEIEVVAELERFIRYHGSSKGAFDIIVASGPNSCYPHHIPGQRRLKNAEPVLIDIGVDYQGYKSDLTRVYFLGKITAYAREVYDIVLDAQQRAIKSIKPGVSIGQIDAAARDYIAKKGYASHFGHNLGHGIGLEVHEEPHISPKEPNVLLPGMVFTIEPAIYLTQKFGIRIEDVVLVTEGKGKVLSGAVNK